VFALLLLVLRLVVPGPGFPGSAFPAGNPARDARLAALLGDVPICHADPDPSSAPSGPGGKPAVPAHDCALCPICELAAAAALLPMAAMIPTPAGVATSRLELPPQSTGPPPDRYGPAPRAPPAAAV
jgi:hypothetical protein